jgi:hypothetical protein
MTIFLKILLIMAGALIIFATLTIGAFVYTQIFKEEEMDPELLSAIMAAINLYRRERWKSS